MSDKNPLARHGGLSYLEIPAVDVEVSARFYERVLAWSIDRRPNGERVFSDGDGLLIGRFKTGRAIAREVSLVPYLYVNDLDAALVTATASGGEIVEPARLEGDTRIARARDPAGNLLGLWQFGG